MRHAHLISIPALLFTTIGCAPYLHTLAEDDGAFEWRRVESEHFVVEGNIDEAALRATAADLQTLRAAFSAVPVLGKRPPHTRAQVVVFDSKREYQWFAGTDSGGVFYPDGTLGPTIVLWRRASALDSDVIRHELTHLLTSEFIQGPKWLTEGLAQVMETARYDRTAEKVVLGDFSDKLLLRAVAVKKAPASELFAPWPRETRSELYGASWLLVHYLIDRHLMEFAAFEVRVSRGEPWREAWAQEIPLGFDEVDDTIRRYLQKARFVLFDVPAVRPPDSALTASVPSRAEIYALRAALHLDGHTPERSPADKRAAAERDVRRALELDPRNPRALQVRAALAR